MSARDLSQIIARAQAGGDLFGRAQATGMIRRTGQPVRRSSYNVGERENFLWREIDPAEINARIRAAEVYDRQNKQPGRRNGILGHVAIEVLAALYRLVDYKTGQLDPAIDTICLRVRRSRSAVVAAMARLKLHGFLNWIRRTEPTGTKGQGPQVRQITNAYVFGLPQAAAAFVARLLGRKPKDAVPAEDLVAGARVAFLKNRPSRPLSPDVLAVLERRRPGTSRASFPSGQNPAPKKKK